MAATSAAPLETPLLDDQEGVSANEAAKGPATPETVGGTEPATPMEIGSKSDHSDAEGLGETCLLELGEHPSKQVVVVDQIAHSGAITVQATESTGTETQQGLLSPISLLYWYSESEADLDSDIDERSQAHDGMPGADSAYEDEDEESDGDSLLSVDHGKVPYEAESVSNNEAFFRDEHEEAIGLQTGEAPTLLEQLGSFMDGDHSEGASDLVGPIGEEEILCGEPSPDVEQDRQAAELKSDLSDVTIAEAGEVPFGPSGTVSAWPAADGNDTSAEEVVFEVGARISEQAGDITSSSATNIEGHLNLVDLWEENVEDDPNLAISLSETEVEVEVHSTTIHKQATTEQSPEPAVSSAQPNDGDTTAEQSEKVASDQPDDGHIDDDLLVEYSHADDTLLEGKPVEDKPAEDKLVENEPVENEPVENEPVEDKQDEHQQGEDTPAQNKQAQSNSVEDKQLEELPAAAESTVKREVSQALLDSAMVYHQTWRPVDYFNIALLVFVSLVSLYCIIVGTRDRIGRQRCTGAWYDGRCSPPASTGWVGQPSVRL